MHGPQTLPESLETAQGPIGRRVVEPAAVAETGREAHHFTQSIEDDELAMRVPRDDHMETVRAQIDGSEHVGHGTTARHLLDQHFQAEKEDPQPQVVFAFGLRMTN
jgi:hypothetical protein